MTWRDRTGRDTTDQLDEIRRKVAEIEGLDPSRWPKHGDASRAVLSSYVLMRSSRDRAIGLLREVLAEGRATHGNSVIFRLSRSTVERMRETVRGR